MFNDVWVSGDTVNVAIGQGFLTVTPLELVVMTSRIANGGYKVKPYIRILTHLVFVFRIKRGCIINSSYKKKGLFENLKGE